MPLQRSYFFWKRVFDVLFSLTLMVLLFPFGVFLLCAVAWETGAFPLYIQDRGVSLEKKPFRIYKLRTMRERSSRKHPPGTANIFFRPEFAEDVSSFCGWLRLTGLDELPQFWNILVGDMSFIGPRPLAVWDLEAMKVESPSLYYMRAALTSPAGLSGLWQLYGNREEGVENLVSLDLVYERTRSLSLDLSLVVKTIPTVLFARRSDAILKKTAAKSNETAAGNKDAGDRIQKSEFSIPALAVIGKQ